MKGRRLSELPRERLAELHREYRGMDPDSAALLRSYLDRLYGETWQSGPGPDSGIGQSPAPMTADERRAGTALGDAGAASGYPAHQLFDA